MTSSARANNVGGTDRPIALAAFRLMTNSNFVGACCRFRKLHPFDSQAQANQIMIAK
jgi:hypothetical protein